MDIKLAQINLARSFGGVHEIIAIIDKWSLGIILIQEPYQRKISWPGFRAYFVSEAPDEMWTLTLVREDICSVVLIHDCSGPMC